MTFIQKFKIVLSADYTFR